MDDKKCVVCGIKLQPNKIIHGWETMYNITSEGLFCKEHYPQARNREFARYPDVKVYK